MTYSFYQYSITIFVILDNILDLLFQNLGHFFLTEIKLELIVFAKGVTQSGKLNTLVCAE